MADRKFTQFDIINIWAFLRRESFSKVARRYGVGHTTIRRVAMWETYKVESRLVDPRVVARAEKALSERLKRPRISDVSYLDEVAF